MVTTKDPETGEPHTGIYRLQQYRPDTLGMHFQIHRVGREQLPEVGGPGRADAGRGGDRLRPRDASSRARARPRGDLELRLRGFLREEPLELVQATEVDLEVPAQAEIVLEGYVDPAEEKMEGPFGDHTGYYSAPEPFPVFHVTHLTHRDKPVYLSTVTGKPPTEDAILGQGGRAGVPPGRPARPPRDRRHEPSRSRGCSSTSASSPSASRYPGHPRKVMHALWGLGQMMFTRYVVIVDEDVDVHDLPEVLYRVGLQADPERDFELVQGPVDQLSISNPVPNFGAKVGIDATRKKRRRRVPPPVARGDPHGPLGRSKGRRRCSARTPSLRRLVARRPP